MRKRNLGEREGKSCKHRIEIIFDLGVNFAEFHRLVKKKTYVLNIKLLIDIIP